MHLYEFYRSSLHVSSLNMSNSDSAVLRKGGIQKGACPLASQYIVIRLYSRVDRIVRYYGTTYPKMFLKK